MKTNMVRILLAEDHTIIRKGMRQILADALPHAEIEEIGEGEEWTHRLKDCPWDVVISNHRRIGSRLEELFPHTAYPLLPVLLLHLYTHEHYGYCALLTGVNGVLGRDAAADELIWAVRQVLAGKKIFAVPSKNN